MTKTKLIALDLDGTLLLPDKTMSARNRAALDAAAAKGIVIVPATGRLFMALPDFLRALPYVRYAIAVNGAQVYDGAEDRVLSRAEMPAADAIALYDEMRRLGLGYDVYMDDRAYMDRRFYDSFEYFFPDDPHIVKMVRAVRTPIDDVYEMVRSEGRSVQKVQCFFPDASQRGALLQHFREKFPHVAVSTSLPHNLEINSAQANKGDALLALCAQLGIDPSESVAFGDGDNDLAMIRAAGTGVAMANGDAAVLAAADAVTASNLEDGVAQYIERFIL